MTTLPGDTGAFGLKKAWKRAKKKATKAAKRAATTVTRSKAFRASVDPRRLAPKALRKSRYFAVAAAPERLAPKRFQRNAFFRAASDPNALSDPRVQRGLNKARKAYGSTVLRVAATGASFVPGMGTGAAAALSAAAALNEGKSLQQIAQEAALGALPGGAAAQIAAQTAINLAQGKSVQNAALGAVRERMPGGALGQAAFDTAVGAAKGQRIDRAAKSAAIRQAREHMPGGALGQAALEAGLGVARGERVDRAVRSAAEKTARQQLPGGALGKAALHTALGVSRGERVDRALIAQGSKLARAELERRGRSALGKANEMYGSRLRLADKNPLGKLPVRRAALSVAHPSVLRAERALARRPELSTMSTKKAARALGLPHASVKKAVARTGPALPWRGLSSPAARMVSSFARAASPYVLSRETAGLAADGQTYTVESGDYGVRIAQKLTGDGNRWRELRSANPQVAGRPDPTNAGFVIYPGDVLQLPPSWVQTAPSAVSAAAILQAKATLAAWGMTDGLNLAGPSDYGQRPEDLTPTWSERDTFMLASFSVWSNTNRGTDLPTSGSITQAHADALQLWAESRVGTLPAPPSGGLPALPPGGVEPPSMPPEVPPIPGAPAPSPGEPAPVFPGLPPGFPALPGLPVTPAPAPAPTPSPVPSPAMPPPPAAAAPPASSTPSTGNDLLPAIGVAALLAKFFLI